MCGGGLEGPPWPQPASMPAPMPGIPVFCLDGGHPYFGIRPDPAGSGAGTNGIAARAGVKLDPCFSTRCGPATGVW